MATQYDSIAQAYHDFNNRRIIRDFLIDPAFFSLLGDVRGKIVLDLACGSGHLTQSIKKLGAERVLGVDISKAMIDLAQKEEQARPLGIEYQIYDATKLPELGQFDLVTAGFLLHYAKSKEELEAMCLGIVKNLIPGGRFVALNNSPFFPISNTPQYQRTVLALDPIKEGSRLRFTFYNKDQTESMSFEFYHWSKETYETAMKKAGLKDIRWIDIPPSEKGVKQFGKDFWNAWEKEPSTILLEARR